MRDLGSPRRLSLPIHARTRFVLVRPHYPENLGAAARALKAMGFGELWVVKPGRLCVPTHDMAFKMAVKAWDVLDAARLVDDVATAVADCEHVIVTTARRGVSGILTARELGPTLVEAAERGERAAILLGNEKTGLAADELALGSTAVRIPMAAAQPSINLAQAVQILAYELFVAALARRDGAPGED